MGEITTIILAHQQTELLQKLLKQVTWSDQVLIVDTSSEGLVFKKLPTHFHHLKKPTAWQKIDFGALRQYALDQVNTEWFLFMDSDELLDEGSEQVIRFFIKESTFSFASLKRTDFFLGKPLHYGEVGDVWITRLGKTKQAQVTGSVHEVIIGKAEKIEVNIHHYAHQSIPEFIQDISRYAYLAAQQEKWYWWSPLKLIFFPFGKFIYNYGIKQGWRDGWRGLVYAILMSLHSLWVRVYSYENQQH